MRAVKPHPLPHQRHGTRFLRSKVAAALFDEQGLGKSKQLIDSVGQDIRKKARRDAFRSLRAAFYVINYEAVAAELVSLRALLRFKRMALVLDESHRIKTPLAKVTRAVLALRSDAAKRYIMTGTPVANKPDDLWSQLFFLDDGTSLGTTFGSFKARYCSSSGGYQRIEEIRDRLSSISLRREKQGTIELPPKTESRP